MSSFVALQNHENACISELDGIERNICLKWRAQ